jgi:aldehyde:ferredoxin oxidoreductase
MDGNGGGHFAARLKLAGYDQVIVYGRSPQPVYLWIKDDQVELRDASHLWGKTTWETQDLLAEELGDKGVSIFTIGPAGENLVRITKVYDDRARAGGKGGMGAVMGSKNLKAVVAQGTGLLRMDSEKRALTTRNSQSGYFEGWEKVTWEAFEEQYAIRHKSCSGCPTACSHVYEVKEGKYSTYGYANQFGTTYPFTSKIGNDNLAATLKLTTMCDQLGLDTHSTGSVISFAMEAWQRGILTAEDTDGLDLSWGNIDAVIELVPKIAYRQGFGAVLAEGSRLASKQIGRGSEICLLEIKGLECSCLSPGGSILNWLAFATAPIGGNHHRGGDRGGSRNTNLRIFKALEVLGKDFVNGATLPPGTYEGQGGILAVENNWQAWVDCLACRMLTGLPSPESNQDDYARLVSTLTGVEIDGEGLMKVGERIFNIEKAFNLREGMRRKDDTLPEQFFVEKIAPEGTSGINRAKFEAALDEYYKFRGWDQESFPTEEKLAELNLSDVAKQLRGLRERRTNILASRSASLKP